MAKAAQITTIEISERIGANKKASEEREQLSHRKKAAEAMQLALVGNETLPLLNSNFRAIPNAFARSALFSVVRPGAIRPFHKDTVIESLSNVHITFRGEELSQEDATVFMSLVYLAVDSVDNKDFFVTEFYAHGFLKELGWTINSRSYQRLKETLMRMKATGINVYVDNDEAGYVGSLVGDVKYNDEKEDGNTRWKVLLSKKIVALYRPNSYSRIFLQQRIKIRSQLAMWLQNFYSSHRDPIPFAVSFLASKCGSASRKLFHFRAELRQACAELEKIGFLDSWDIDNIDRLVVKRKRAIADDHFHSAAIAASAGD